MAKNDNDKSNTYLLSTQTHFKFDLGDVVEFETRWLENAVEVIFCLAG